MNHTVTPKLSSVPQERPSDVYFFATCVVDQFMPQAGLDAVTLLREEGIYVHFPAGQTCCGQPAYTSGFSDAARQVARAQLGIFPQNWPIVIPSGSCAGMFRHHYPKLFAGCPEAPQAQALAARVFEFSEFLVCVLRYQPQTATADTGRTGPAVLPKEKVVLHTSCAARREMSSHITSHALLSQLDHVEIYQQEHEAECCGFGGTFALRHAEISAAMVSDKVAEFRKSGAERVVSADCGCLLNILGHAQYSSEKNAAAKFPGEHLASLLLRHRRGISS